MIADELKRLHELHQAGVLSDAEYEQAKAKVLGAGPGPSLDKEATPAGSNINRLRRSRTDRWIGGVCGGLAAATEVESWVWRLMFVLSVCVFGVGFGIYLLLWIFVPEE
jgi:phage shock protein PspC (stress-responsive transcriptional regulator)